MKIVGHIADMYYIPMKYLKDYTTLLNLFFKHLIWTEIAVTTVLVCLEEKNQTQVHLLIEGSTYTQI